MAADPPFNVSLPVDFPEVGDFVCQRFELPDICEILMPGGLSIAAPNVLELIQPALTPLAPMFAFMEAVVQVKNCIEAAVEAISDLDPGPLIDCVPGLAQRVDKLLSMLPQASIPLMAVDLLDCALAILARLRSTLVSMLDQLARIQRTLERAAELDDARLNLLAICASDRLADTLSDEMKGLIVVGRIIGLVAFFLGLAGVDVDVPDFESVSSLPLADLLEAIDALVEALGVMRDAIPVPE